MSAIDAVAARLAAEVPSRQIYTHGPPSGELPENYIIVVGNIGDEDSSRLDDSSDIRRPMVWVTSVSHSSSEARASHEATWGAQRVRDVLRGFTPELGRMAWRVTPAASAPAERDGALPKHTFYAVEQFMLQHQA